MLYLMQILTVYLKNSNVTINYNDKHVPTDWYLYPFTSPCERPVSFLANGTNHNNHIIPFVSWIRLVLLLLQNQNFAYSSVSTLMGLGGVF